MSQINDKDWRNLMLFYEYFHEDIGAGIGANHQTGWTGLVAKLIQQWENTQVKIKLQKLFQSARLDEHV